MIQISVFDVCQAQPKTFDDYIGRCEYCGWGKGMDKYTCQWSCQNPDRHSYNRCDNGSFWKPDSWKIPELCGGCKYANEFVNQGDAWHPIEEPNIYCTRCGGSINRMKPYKQFEQDGFGVGSWHRQHEWDTCEGWEKNETFGRYNKNKRI